MANDSALAPHQGAHGGPPPQWEGFASRVWAHGIVHVLERDRENEDYRYRPKRSFPGPFSSEAELQAPLIYGKPRANRKWSYPRLALPVSIAYS